MGKFIVLLELIIFFDCIKNQIENENDNTLKGVYLISSCSNKLYFSIKNNILGLSYLQTNFRIISNNSNSYRLITRGRSKIIGINNKNDIYLYNTNTTIINETQILWNLIKVKGNHYLIQNKFNRKYLEEYKNNLNFTSNIDIYLDNSYNKIKKNILFNLIKIFEDNNFNKKNRGLIKKEPIDLVIKYIDLTDRTLNRNGIKQIYKDQDNEELRYSIRSILNYIPWVRKIFILMPNEKVKFFKPYNEIQDKIQYIKDKDLLGFDSANSFSFSFNLFKMKKFGLSRNFIYMDDDYFIGNQLKKSDLFYFNEEKNAIFPYCLTTKFYQINQTFVLNEYYNKYKINHLIHPHSSEGFWFGMFITEKYFMENYKFPLINTEFSHNAISENIDDLSICFEMAKKFEYFKETIFSKERFIMTLNHQHFYNLYQLNIKNEKVHPIKRSYILIEKIKNENLNIPFFVANTGGNHKPLDRQNKILQKILSKRFPLKTKYETNIKKDINYNDNNNKIYFFIVKFFFLFILIKNNLLKHKI
jgi:hypothetical protein